MEFTGARLKVKRANKHILELNTALQDFAKTDFYDLGIKENLKIGYDVLQLRTIKSFPAEDAAPVVGDAIHNLRSALDLMISDIVRGRGESVNRAKFPIGIIETEETREQLIKRFSNGVVEKCLPKPLWDDIFNVIKPYKGGNTAICAIHDLDIRDKHTLLTPVMTVASLTGVSLKDETGFHMVNCAMAIEKDGAISAVGWPKGTLKNPEIYDKGKPAADIFFQPGIPLQGQAIIPTLKLLSELVSGIIKRFEIVYFGK